jgi:hypothetical protein
LNSEFSLVTALVGPTEHNPNRAIVIAGGPIALSPR